MDEITKADIWAEIKKYSPRVETLEDTDITVAEMCAMKNCGDAKARRIIYEIGNTPGWQAIHVRKPSGSGYVLVLRKIDTPAE